MLPPETQQLCTKYVALVEARTYHELKLEERFAIYHSFGPSRLDAPGYLKTGRLFNYQESVQVMENELLNFNAADYCLGWLAILTSSYVFPVWDQIKDILDENELVVTAQEVVQVAKDLLQRKITYLEAGEAQEEFEWEGEALAHKVTYNIDCAFSSARYSLDFVARGLPRRAYRATEGEGVDHFVTTALEAYSAIDLNAPGALSPLIPYSLIENLAKVLKLENIEEEYPPDNTLDLEYSLEKRLQFWKWWLTEAIPQAWELAQQSFSQK